MRFTKTAYTTAILLFASQVSYAATTISQGPANEFEFISSGTEQVSISTTGDLRVRNNVFANTFVGDSASLTSVISTQLEAGDVSVTGDLLVVGNVSTSTPTANNHAATKAYVDSAVAAAGGGSGVTYAGVTTTTYNGTFTSRLRGLHEACESAFAGSRAMHSSDLKYIVKDITSTDQAWLQCDELSVTKDSLSSFTCSGMLNSGENSSIDYALNCRGWSTSNSALRGWTYTGSTGYLGVSQCNNTYKIHCVYD